MIEEEYKRHNHNGVDSQLISIYDLIGMVETVESVTGPTYTPKRFNQQIKIHRDGATANLYIYDNKNAAWYKNTLTAA